MKDLTMDESNETTDINDILLKLGREHAIKEGFTPTGRKVGVGLVANTALYRLQYVDSKPGKLPAPYDGMYTRVEYAAADLKRYLEEFWDTSERAGAKKLRKEHAERASAA